MFNVTEKRLERQLLDRMGSLTRVAQLATYTAMANELGRSRLVSESEGKAIGMKAAAAINFLFGSGTNETHAKQLNLALEHAAALEWLKVRPLYRELVVQSLRVIRMIEFGKDRTRSPIVGEAILLELGAQFPNAPTPETYEALVLRVVKVLPKEDQDEATRWVAHGTPSSGS